MKSSQNHLQGSLCPFQRNNMTSLTHSITTEISRARKTIANAHAGLIRVSERDTIQKLVMPMLSTIGWDVLDLAEVREELQSAGGGRADIACFTGGRVVMFTEAKAINESIDEPKFISQAMKYGTDEGANWCVLTNGRLWAIYHANAQGKAADKLFWRFDITNPAEHDLAIETLTLLAKSAMEDREIERAWQRDHADRRVEMTLRTLLAGDKAFINLIRKRIQADYVDLAPKQIREALARLDLRVGSRLAPDETPRHDVSHTPSIPSGVTAPVDKSEASETETPCIRVKRKRHLSYEGEWPKDATHVIHWSDCLAFGAFDEVAQTMRLLPGAKCVRARRPDVMTGSIREIQDAMIADGRITDDGEYLIASEGLPAGPPSRSADFATTGAANGWHEWIGRDGQRLKVLRRS